jgi:hypothetical protein
MAFATFHCGDNLAWLRPSPEANASIRYTKPACSTGLDHELAATATNSVTPTTLNGTRGHVMPGKTGQVKKDTRGDHARSRR